MLKLEFKLRGKAASGGQWNCLSQHWSEAGEGWKPLDRSCLIKATWPCGFPSPQQMVAVEFIAKGKKELGGRNGDWWHREHRWKRSQCLCLLFHIWESQWNVCFGWLFAINFSRWKLHSCLGFLFIIIIKNVLKLLGSADFAHGST